MNNGGTCTMAAQASAFSLAVSTGTVPGSSVASAAGMGFGRRHHGVLGCGPGGRVTAC